MNEYEIGYKATRCMAKYICYDIFVAITYQIKEGLTDSCEAHQVCYYPAFFINKSLLGRSIIRALRGFNLFG